MWAHSEMNILKKYIPNNRNECTLTIMWNESLSDVCVCLVKDSVSIDFYIVTLELLFIVWRQPKKWLLMLFDMAIKGQNDLYLWIGWDSKIRHQNVTSCISIALNQVSLQFTQNGERWNILCELNRNYVSQRHQITFNPNRTKFARQENILSVLSNRFNPLNIRKRKSEKKVTQRKNNHFILGKKHMSNCLPKMLNLWYIIAG